MGVSADSQAPARSETPEVLNARAPLPLQIGGACAAPPRAHFFSQLPASAVCAGRARPRQQRTGPAPGSATARSRHCPTARLQSSRSHRSMTSRAVPGGWMPLVRQESGMSSGFVQAPHMASDGASMSKSRHSPVVKQKTRRAEVQALWPGGQIPVQVLAPPLWAACHPCRAGPPTLLARTLRSHGDGGGGQDQPEPTRLPRPPEEVGQRPPH